MAYQVAKSNENMRPAILTLLLCVCFYLSVSNSKAQETTTPEFIEKQLDTYVNEAINNWQVPGAAIAIVKDGKLFLAKGYGFKTVGGADPVDKHTSFFIGSTTKAFTATAIAKLAREHSFSLDEPVRKLLPEFALSDEYLTEKVTFQDLLSHRSGLGTFQGDFMFYDSALTKPDMFKALSKLELQNAYKTFGYTNVGYFVAGEAIERLSGESFVNYLQNTFFVPLDMKNTIADSSKFNDVKNRADAHTLRANISVPREVGDGKNMAAAGGVSSSVYDLGNWMRAQLQEGEFNGAQIIPSEVIDATRTPQILIGRSAPPYTIFNNSNFETYSSGWYHIDYEGREIVTHNGGGYGYTASITLVPELDLGIAILTNSDAHLLFETFKLEIIDAYLGLPFRNYSAIAKGIFDAQTQQKEASLQEAIDMVRAASEPEMPLAEYQGVYKNAAYGDTTITQDGDILKMRFQHHPDLVGTLRFIKEGEFLSEYNKTIYGSSIIPFEIKDGEVVSMKFSVDSYVEPNSYLFHKVRASSIKR